jgi:hypothetical protein
MMRVIYLAHPLGSGPDRETNRAAAAKWLAHFVGNGVAVIADWIILSGEWAELPEKRALGMAANMALVARCDEVWMVGGRVSPGMKAEAEEARRLGKAVLDLTWMGALPPSDLDARHGDDGNGGHG